MAIKLRLGNKTEGEDPPKKTLKLRMVSSIPDIQKDPSIKGPIGFLNSYYNSNEFRNRYQDKNNEPINSSTLNRGILNYKAQIKPFDGSHAASVWHMRELAKEGKDRAMGATITLDPEEAKAIGSDLLNDTLPHEYSHTTRGLTLPEEEIFSSKNKNKVFIKKYPYKKFLSNGSVGNSLSNGIYENMYSNYLGIKNEASHDEQPSENYADLNALRYMLYKQEIYDTRKGPMTLEHLKKAMNDPWLKKQFSLQRLLKTFKPEDIVTLNNTIAMNDKKDKSPSA